MKIIIFKILLFLIYVPFTYALHGKIVFYDGTYVVGKVTKVDESSVYIVPIGLDTAEGVLTGNIDSLKLENGMMPVINSAVKYFYQNGEFLANDDDWLDEFDDFKYSNYDKIQDPYNYEEVQVSNQGYYQLSVTGAYPVYIAESLQDDFGNNVNPRFGMTFRFPYYPVGALDVAPGFQIMSHRFESQFQGKVSSLELAFTANFDFKPIFYFMPQNIHLSADFGLGLNTGLSIDQNKDKYPLVETISADSKYQGIGVHFGGSVDYWMTNIPLAFRMYLKSNMIPQAPPFQDKFTLYSDIGISLIVVMKRHHMSTSRK